MNRIPGVESNDARWQAQERALTGAPSDAGDALLAHALRTLPSASPPSDFAARVSQAAMRAHGVEADDQDGELVLVRLLVAVMALGTMVCAFVYGSAWATTIATTLGDDALRWGLAGSACLAASALPWRRALAFAQRTPVSG